MDGNLAPGASSSVVICLQVCPASITPLGVTGKRASPGLLACNRGRPQRNVTSGPASGVVNKGNAVVFAGFAVKGDVLERQGHAKPRTEPTPTPPNAQYSAMNLRSRHATCKAQLHPASAKRIQTGGSAAPIGDI